MRVRRKTAPNITFNLLKPFVNGKYRVSTSFLWFFPIFLGFCP